MVGQSFLKHSQYIYQIEQSIRFELIEEINGVYANFIWKYFVSNIVNKKHTNFLYDPLYVGM